MTTPQQSNWVPDWAKRAVFYHIYPLGFLAAPQRNPLKGDPVPRLAGIRQWYDHLSLLGITAIYFGPLFESHSHGYDTIDYFQIDRRLGDNSLFQTILSELHDRGISIILDGVFNHTGRDFFAFKDIRANGKASSYHDWFFINWGDDSRYHDGFGYESWEGHQSLPKLNTENPDVRNYLFEVARMWMEDVGIDGWRLDVAYELSTDFWWEFRRVCKQARPSAFLVGELIRGDYRTWIADDLLDSGTNYDLYTALFKALNQNNYWTLRAALEREQGEEFGVYRDLSLMTFLGNHDVTRLISNLENPSHVYNALIFLYTAPGIPCLYYGDETGMEGKKEDGDQALRMAMPLPGTQWPERGRGLYHDIIRLITLRKAHSALQIGTTTNLDTGHTFFSFLRRYESQLIVVVLNSSDKPLPVTIHAARAGIPDGTSFYEILNPEHAAYTVHDGLLEIDSVAPWWGRVLLASA